MEAALVLLNTLISRVEPSSIAASEPCDVVYMRKVWSKYESIPNSYNDKSMAYLTEQGHTADGIVWCASEKVHGANFALISNGVDVIAASRTQILDAKTKFYAGWRDVLEQETPRCLRAIQSLKRRYKNKIKCVIIYGEYFGGIFSHYE